MLYRYLRPLPILAPPDGNWYYSGAGLPAMSEISPNGQYMVIGSSIPSGNTGPFFQYGDVNSDGTPNTPVNANYGSLAYAGANNAYNKTRNQYFACLLSDVSISNTGQIAYVNYAANPAFAQGGSNVTQQADQTIWCKVGSASTNGFPQQVYVNGTFAFVINPEKDSLCIWSPAGDRLVVTCRTVLNGNVKPYTYTGPSDHVFIFSGNNNTYNFTSQAQFTNTAKKMAMMGWIDNDNLLYGLHADATGTSAVSYFIYNVPAGTTQSAITGLPQMSTAYYARSSRWYSLGGSKFLLAWVDDSGNMSASIIGYSGSAFTTISTAAIVTGSAGNMVYCALLGSGHVMLGTNASISRYYDISADTFVPKEITIAGGYGLVGHPASGKLFQVSGGAPPTSYPVATGRVYTYTLPPV